MLKQSHWKGLLIWEASMIILDNKNYLEVYWISEKGINSESADGFLIMKTITFKNSKVKNTLERKCTKAEANDMLRVKLLVDNIKIESKTKCQ